MDAVHFAFVPISDIASILPCLGHVRLGAGSEVPGNFCAGRRLTMATAPTGAEPWGAQSGYGCARMSTP